MKLRYIALALLISGTVGTTIPAFAAGSTDNGTIAAPVTTDSGQGDKAGSGSAANGTDNSSAGNGGNGQVGDNPNTTDPGYKCYRRDKAGETEIVCPADMQTK